MSPELLRAEMIRSTTSGVISIDNGGHSTCIVTKRGQEMFPSVKGKFGDRRLTKATGRYDYIVDYMGEKYVCGDLADLDCKLPLQMHTKSKQNDFYDLSILISIHQFGYDDNQLITSVPIGMFTESEQQGLIARLKGTHTITVNDIKKTFDISKVKIAPETAVAYWINEIEGKSNYIDLGSRTIGYSSIKNRNGKPTFLDTESGTMYGKGLMALGTDFDQKGLADYICGILIKDWSEDDTIFLLGGGALDNKLVENIQNYFPRARPMSNPQMANALGMYKLGEIAYGTH